MPVVYVSGKLEVQVDLGKDDDFEFEQWTDADLKEQRKSYKKSTVGLQLESQNPEDEISPFALPISDLDMYQGALRVSQSGREFIFSFDGAAKVNAHKDTKAAVDGGAKFQLTGVSINGQQVGVTKKASELTIQSKKF